MDWTNWNSNSKFKKFGKIFLNDFLIFSDLTQSPSKNSVHLEIPPKSVSINQQQSKYHSSGVNRKSPKRRPVQRYTPSSSSSTESLTGSTTKDNSMPSIKCKICNRNFHWNFIQTSNYDFSARHVNREHWDEAVWQRFRWRRQSMFRIPPLFQH